MSKSGMGKFYSEKPSRYPGWWRALPYSKEQKTVSARLKLSSTTTFSQQEGIEQMTKVWDFLLTKDSKVVRFASVHLPLVRTLATSSFKGLWLRSHVPMQGCSPLWSAFLCLEITSQDFPHVLRHHTNPYSEVILCFPFWKRKKISQLP